MPLLGPAHPLAENRTTTQDFAVPPTVMVIDAPVMVTRVVEDVWIRGETASVLTRCLLFPLQEVVVAAKAFSDGERTRQKTAAATKPENANLAVNATS
jgi:hypothetical protein